MRQTDLIEVKDVSFKFGDKPVFNDLSFSVAPGDLVIIKGPSGSGKSTLLRLLNRLIDPSSGSIMFADKALSEYNPVELRRKVCYLQQTPLMVQGTVKQNLLLSFAFSSANKLAGPKEEILAGLLNQFKLNDVSLEDKAADLSVGQKQRLAFIRALLLKPEVLLLDEPTSALDPESRSVIENHIEKLAADESHAIIIVTHIGFNPDYRGLRTYELSDGRLKEIGQ